MHNKSGAIKTYDTRWNTEFTLVLDNLGKPKHFVWDRASMIEYFERI